MAEVSYTTVVFKTKGARSKAKEVESEYDDVGIPSETRENHPDTNAGLSADEAKKRRHYQKLAYCFGTFCVILLLSIGGLLGGFFTYTRTCQPCEKGWIHNQSSCYAVNDHGKAAKRGNWEEAQEDCRGKGSDLVVVADDDEKKYISDYSWSSSGFHGYWIGLRAEHGKWKWVDGSDLAETSWITGSPTDGRCVIVVKYQGWKSVECDGKQQWICEKAALSV